MVVVVAVVVSAVVVAGRTSGCDCEDENVLSGRLSEVMFLLLLFFFVFCFRA